MIIKRRMKEIRPVIIIHNITMMVMMMIIIGLGDQGISAAVITGKFG